MIFPFFKQKQHKMVEKGWTAPAKPLPQPVNPQRICWVPSMPDKGWTDLTK